jgi:hypothetical protein
LLLLFWAARSADVIRKLGWSHRACRYTGLAFLLPGSALFSSRARAISVAKFLAMQIIFSAYISRRIALPEISDEQALAPEPLAKMFAK